MGQGQTALPAAGHPWLPRRVGRAIHEAQNMLPFHNKYLDRKNRPIEGDPLTGYYRSEVARLQSEAYSWRVCRAKDLVPVPLSTPNRAGIQLENDTRYSLDLSVGSWDTCARC